MGQAVKIERVLVWSGWLRVAHLAVGGAALLLLMTGWLLEWDASPVPAAADFHNIAAAVLIFGVVIRVWLLFAGRPIERLEKLLPAGSEWTAARETLVFYLTLGKMPLPRWYAHNPLWKLLYLVLYILLLALIASGLLRADQDFVMGIYLPDVHVFAASMVGWWMLLHVVAVVLHDYHGDATDASSIINGHRQFVVEKPVPDTKGIGETVIRLDEIGRLNK